MAVSWTCVGKLCSILTCLCDGSQSDVWGKLCASRELGNLKLFLKFSLSKHEKLSWNCSLADCLPLLRLCKIIMRTRWVAYQLTSHSSWRIQSLCHRLRALHYFLNQWQNHMDLKVKLHLGCQLVLRFFSLTHTGGPPSMTSLSSPKSCLLSVCVCVWQGGHQPSIHNTKWTIWLISVIDISLYAANCDALF